MTVLVSFKTLIDRFPRLFDPDGKPTVGHDELVNLIKLLLASVAVDDAWYRRRYPDVSAAVDAGD